MFGASSWPKWGSRECSRGLVVRVPTMNPDVCGSYPAGDLCCMSFPSVCHLIYCKLSNKGIKCQTLAFSCLCQSYDPCCICFNNCASHPEETYPQQAAQCSWPPEQPAFDQHVCEQWARWGQRGPEPPVRQSNGFTRHNSQRCEGWSLT